MKDGAHGAMADGSANAERRSWLSKLSTGALALGMLGGYGAFALISGRFLYPARGERKAWLYVAEAKRLAVGDALLYEGPQGETVNVTRQGGDGVAGDFLALSSTCPHLGCQVHWEAHNDRFFCPCHNGVFDPSGKGVSGPPGDAGLDLPRYPLKIEGGLLFIEMQVESLESATGGRDEPQGRVIERVQGIHGPGHDPCLSGRNTRPAVGPCASAGGGQA